MPRLNGSRRTRAPFAAASVRRAVERAVVDDDDVEPRIERAELVDHAADVLLLVQRGDDRDAAELAQARIDVGGAAVRRSRSRAEGSVRGRRGHPATRRRRGRSRRRRPAGSSSIRGSSTGVRKRRELAVADAPQRPELPPVGRRARARSRTSQAQPRAFSRSQPCRERERARCRARPRGGPARAGAAAGRRTPSARRSGGCARGSTPSAGPAARARSRGARRRRDRRAIRRPRSRARQHELEILLVEEELLGEAAELAEHDRARIANAAPLAYGDVAHGGRPRRPGRRSRPARRAR